MHIYIYIHIDETHPYSNSRADCRTEGLLGQIICIHICLCIFTDMYAYTYAHRFTCIYTYLHI